LPSDTPATSTSMKALMSQGTPRVWCTLTSGVRSAGEARQAGAEAEGDEPDEPRVDAERLRQLLVHDHAWVTIPICVRCITSQTRTPRATAIRRRTSRYWE